MHGFKGTISCDTRDAGKAEALVAMASRGVPRHHLRKSAVINAAHQPPAVVYCIFMWPNHWWPNSLLGYFNFILENGKFFN